MYMFIVQVRDREATITGCREENEQQQQRLRAVKEELAERDGQLRVAKMNTETLTKQNQHHMQEVNNMLLISDISSEQKDCLLEALHAGGRRCLVLGYYFLLNSETCDT